MSAKERLKKRLLAAREYSLALLHDFAEPRQWTHQVHGAANHALWFAGHMAVVDNFFVSTVAPERVVGLPEFEKAFGMGSQPTSDPADYPPVSDVLEVMNERRRTLLDVLDALDDAALEQPTPKGTPDFLPDVAAVFETAVWHEGLHSGQLSVARRAMGHRPVMEPPGA